MRWKDNMFHKKVKKVKQVSALTNKDVNITLTEVEDDVDVQKQRSRNQNQEGQTLSTDWRAIFFRCINNDTII